MEKIVRIEINYLPEYRDFLRVLLGWVFRRFKVFFLLMALMGLLFVGSAVLTNRYSNLFLLLIPVVLTGLITSTAFISARNAAREIKGTVKYTFTPEVIYVTAPNIEVRVGWAEYHEVRETKSDFVLSPIPGAVIPLPKRFFRDENQIMEFKDLVRKGMGKRAKLIG